MLGDWSVSGVGCAQDSPVEMEETVQHIRTSHERIASNHSHPELMSARLIYKYINIGRQHLPFIRKLSGKGPRKGSGAQCTPYGSTI
jgi:hypothetical protein